MNQETYLYHHGVKGMKWGVRKDKYKKMSRSERKKAKQNYKNNANKQHNIKLAKSYATSERRISKEYADKANKLSKMSDRDYIKDMTGYDISTKQGRKSYMDEYNVSPSSVRKNDILNYKRRSQYSSENAKKFDQLAKAYGKLNVNDLSKKEATEKGRQLIEDIGVDVYYRVRAK